MVHGIFKHFIQNVIYNNDEELVYNKYKNSQNSFIVQMIFGSTFMLLATGVNLAGFAVYLGVSDQLVGYISLISSICGILVVFSGLFFERFKNRRKIIIILNTIGKTCIASVIWIPIIITEKYQIIVFFMMMIIGFSLNTLMGVGINSLLVDVVPSNIRGRYFAIRKNFGIGLSICTRFIAGRILDIATDKYIGFVILFSVAYVMILLENIAFWKIEEPEINSLNKISIKFLDVFKIPLKNKKFINFTVSIMFFNLALHMSNSFINLYMIRYLNLSYTYISLTTIMMCILQLFFYRLWGRIGDKYGHKNVINISIWCYIIYLFIWVIVSKSIMYFTIPIAYIFLAIASSGYTTSQFNIKYSIIPEKGRTLYDGFYLASMGITLLLSPLLGGKIKSLINNYEFFEKMINYSQFRVLFLISVIMLILYQIINSKKKNSEEITSKVFVLSVLKEISYRN